MSSPNCPTRVAFEWTASSTDVTKWTFSCWVDRLCMRPLLWILNQMQIKLLAERPWGVLQSRLHPVPRYHPLLYIAVFPGCASSSAGGGAAVTSGGFPTSWFGGIHVTYGVSLCSGNAGTSGLYGWPIYTATICLQYLPGHSVLICSLTMRLLFRSWHLCGTANSLRRKCFHFLAQCITIQSKSKSKP